MATIILAGSFVDLILGSLYKIISRMIGVKNCTVIGVLVLSIIYFLRLQLVLQSALLILYPFQFGLNCL